MKVPVVTLSNGLRVANFSSPHSFEFVDGTVLPACSDDRCKSLPLDIEEECEISPCGRFTNVTLTVRYSSAVETELAALEARDDIDIVLVPRMLKDAVGAAFSKAKCVRVADRVTKEIYEDKFTV